MIRQNKSEKGQALILIVFAIMGLLALVGLAMDGGQTFSDRRKAQNAADAAALAAALDFQKDNNVSDFDLTHTAKVVAATNGYDDNGASNVVTVEPVALTGTECAGGVGGKDIKVTINSTVTTWFAPVVGVKELKNTVSGTARACNFHFEPLFMGNAVVALKPSGDSVYINGNAKWRVKGGGVYANSDFQGKCGKPFVLDPGEAVTAVGAADCVPSGTDSQTGVSRIPFPTDWTDKNNPIVSIMPPTPPCDGSKANGTEDRGITAATDPTSFASFNFSNGVYCVDNMDAFDKQDIVLNNAVLYVRDSSFSIKFSGGGGDGHGFAGSGRQTGPYAGYYMVIAPSSLGPGHQEIEWRGNGHTDGIWGTILAPTATIDYRGNSAGNADHSQLIAYEVQTLGDADIVIDYKDEENRQAAMPPTIQLLK